MDRQQIDNLVEKYWVGDGKPWPKGYLNPQGELEYNWIRYEDESARILYSLVRHYQPISSLEIGAAFGFSSAINNMAMIRNGKPYKFLVAEINSDYLAKCKELHRLSFSTVPTYCGDIMKNLNKVPKKLDYLFIDTDHDLELTEWYVAKIFPRLVKEAIIAMHDWAVKEENGKLIGKGQDGVGAFPETIYLMELIQNKKIPMKKLYWAWENNLDTDKWRKESAWFSWNG